MSRVEIDEERCKGCLLCTSVCPKGALQQAPHLNKQGYKPVQVPEDRLEDCIGCGFCAEICPDLAITVFRSREEQRHEDAA